MHCNKSELHTLCKQTQSEKITIKNEDYSPLQVIDTIRSLCKELNSFLTLEVGRLSSNIHTNEQGQQITLTIERGAAIKATQS